MITSFRQDLIEWDYKNKEKMLPNKIRKLREKWEKQCIKDEWILLEDEIRRIEKFKFKDNFYK
jgi:hypothetical protein